MILEYLNVEQTLDYLQRETDYRYTFDDLKELNYLKSMDVFFFKVCTIYSTRTGGIAHSIQKVKGIFFVEDILFDNESDGQTFWFRKIYAHVEKIIEHLGHLDDTWHSYQKGQAGLVSTSDIIDLEYNEDFEVLSYSLQKNAINNIERSDLRFKKSQLDKLIKQSKVNIDVLENLEPEQQRIIELQPEYPLTLTPIQKYILDMQKIVFPLAEKIWSYDKSTNLLMRKQVAELIVKLLPSLELRVPQVDKWLKDSYPVPQAIIDRCAQNDYGNKKHETIEREKIQNKIYVELSNENSKYL